MELLGKNNQIKQISYKFSVNGWNITELNITGNYKKIKKHY